MTDRVKLAVLIKQTFDEQYAKCGLLTVHNTVEHLITHGVTVKEPLKPLTVEELMKKPGSVWYENDTAIAPMMVSNRKSFSVLYLKDVVFGLYRSNAFDCFNALELPVSDYGKTWRCWAEKPTEEERKAAEWME